MCTQRPPDVVETPTEHPNSRLANGVAYDQAKQGGIALADNSKKVGFDAFKLGGVKSSGS